jgi:hypothetical protein
MAGGLSQPSQRAEIEIEILEPEIEAPGQVADRPLQSHETSAPALQGQADWRLCICVFTERHTPATSQFESTAQRVAAGVRRSGHVARHRRGGPSRWVAR